MQKHGSKDDCHGNMTWKQNKRKKKSSLFEWLYNYLDGQVWHIFVHSSYYHNNSSLAACSLYSRDRFNFILSYTYQVLVSWHVTPELILVFCTCWVRLAGWESSGWNTRRSSQACAPATGPSALQQLADSCEARRSHWVPPGLSLRGDR